MELLTLVVLIVIAVELGILAWMIRWALGKISNPVLDYALPTSLPWPLVEKGNIATDPPIPDPMKSKTMGDHLIYAMCAMKTYLSMHQQRPIK